MNEKQWEVGEDEEELFEYAMHPAQYEAYRSGKAKVEFKADVAKRKAEKANAGKPTVPATPAAPAPAPAATLTMPTTPQVMTVDVNGQAYRVTVALVIPTARLRKLNQQRLPPRQPRRQQTLPQALERGAFSAGR
mgnify:CR=1 FL=1